MLRHKNSAHTDMNSDEDAMSDVSKMGDIFGPINDNESSHSDDDDGTSITSEESSVIDPWNEIVEEAFLKCQSEFDSEVNELMEKNSDISESEAREKTFRKMKSTYREAMMNSFGSKLLWFDAMKQDHIYKSIKRTVKRLIDTDEYDEEEALKYGILKRRFLFDKVLDTYEIPELEREDDMEQEEDSE